MKRFASTRSENLASQPGAGRAQWSVGSMDDEGMRYGFTTHALTASTIAIAPTIVTIQSTTTLTFGGSLPVTRSRGWWCGVTWLGSDGLAPNDGGGVGHENGGAGGGGSEDGGSPGQARSGWPR